MREVRLGHLLHSWRWMCMAFLLPHDLLPWKTVYHYFRLWRIDGVWQQMNQSLREKVRLQAGREVTPSAGIIDSQSVKTTEVAREVGYDGAKLSHCVASDTSRVDVLGMLLQVVVSAEDRY